MLNYLKTTELKRDELIRLVECYEAHGVTETRICVGGDETHLKQIENRWVAQKETVLKILKRTKAGWRLYSPSLKDLSEIEDFAEAA